MKRNHFWMLIILSLFFSQGTNLWAASQQTSSSSSNVVTKEQIDADIDSMMGGLRDMTKKVDEMLKTGWNNTSWDTITGGNNPRLDLQDGKERYVLRLDVPGMTKNDLSIEAKEDKMTISGERKFESSQQEGSYSRQERSFGSFTRTITFSELVKPEEISAEYKDGVLTVFVPKKNPSPDETAVKVKIQ